tara:strand:+ start:1301 stop:1453 length:153 start_codon:yes stop_codon:yes gene_type:complete
MPDTPDQYSTWFNLWMGLLYAALGVFSVIAVIVSIKGWQEIKTMLRKLKE